MAMPSEQIVLVDAQGKRIVIDDLVGQLRQEAHRVLADDEVGLIVYVGDLNLFSLTPTDSGDYFSQPVKEISCPRFPARVLRKQIGPTVLSVTADAVFVVKDGKTLKKVRAEKLEPGMVLASGEKVYR